MLHIIIYLFLQEREVISEFLSRLHPILKVQVLEELLGERLPLSGTSLSCFL